MAKKELPTLKDVSRVPEELRPVVLWWQDHGTKALTWGIVVVAVCVAAYLWHADNRAADATAFFMQNNADASAFTATSKRSSKGINSPSAS